MKTTRAHGEDAAQRPVSRSIVALALALSAAASPWGCRRVDEGLRGQSGSEAPAGSGGSPTTPDATLPCPCDASGIFLRVTVLAADDPARGAAPASVPGEEPRDAAGTDGAVLRSVRVDGVIHGDTDRLAGARLNVEDDGQLPCFFGSAPVADGQQALALFTPADPARCDAGDAGTCADGSVRLTPWADQLVFAQTAEGSLSVPASELESLWTGDIEACMARHGDVSQLFERSPPAPDAAPRAKPRQ